MVVLRVSGIVEESVVDGPGLRFVVFAQGCPHRCQGCHNPGTWDFEGGKTITVEELLKKIRANPLLKGVTLSGGEPFAQASQMAELAKEVKGTGMDVITYTGYTFEKLLTLCESDPGIKSLLENTDYLIDGPYLKDQRDLGLPFRGSRNQRFLDVRASLERKTPVCLHI